MKIFAKAALKEGKYRRKHITDGIEIQLLEDYKEPHKQN